LRVRDGHGVVLLSHSAEFTSKRGSKGSPT
jgi:hypothetical protein